MTASSIRGVLSILEINGNYSYNLLHRDLAGTTNYPGERASVNARQPLFDLQAYLLMKSQESRTSQSEEELLAAYQKVIADLVERYMNCPGCRR